MSSSRNRRRAPIASTIRTVAIYCRISRDLRGDAMGVERQEAACRNLILARWGEDVSVVLYVDNDVSAYDRKVVRPEFERMLNDADEHQFDVIVAWDLDRIGRRLTDLERCVRMAEMTGVPMVTVNGDFDLTSASGKAYARIVMAIAEMESDHKSERLVAKFEYDRAAGRPLWRRRPFGYQMDGTIIEEEAAVLRCAAQRLIDGEGLTSVVMSLQHVIAPWGKPFTMLSLKQNLLAPRYIAKSTGRDGEIYGDGVWEPIFDMETHQRLLARFPAHPEHNTTPYLCTGILYCQHCELRLNGRNDKARGRADYKCLKQPSLHRYGCGLSVTSSAVDKAVVDALISALADPANRRRIMASRVGVEDIDELLGLLDDLKARKRSLVKMVADGLLEEQDARSQVSDLNQQINAAQSQFSSFSDRPSPLADLPYDEDELRSIWEDMSLMDQREVLKEAIQRIDVRRATSKGGSVFDRDRIHIVWPTAAASPLPAAAPAA